MDACRRDLPQKEVKRVTLQASLDHPLFSPPPLLPSCRVSSLFFSCSCSTIAPPLLFLLLLNRKCQKVCNKRWSTSQKKTTLTHTAKQTYTDTGRPYEWITEVHSCRWPLSLSLSDSQFSPVSSLPGGQFILATGCYVCACECVAMCVWVCATADCIFLLSF